MHSISAVFVGALLKKKWKREKDRMKAGKTEKEKYLEGALSIIACSPFI